MVPNTHCIVPKHDSLAIDNAPSEFPPFPPDWKGVLELKRTDQTRIFVRTVLRRLPRNGGSARLLMCPHCDKPRRMLYGWEPGGQYTSSVVRSNWACRRCNQLRYASEGGALIHRARGALGCLFDSYDGPMRSERPEPWCPYVFTDADEATRWIEDSRKYQGFR